MNYLLKIYVLQQLEYSTLLGSSIQYNLDHDTKTIDEIILQRFGEDDIIQGTFKDLHDPYLLRDMDKAVARLKQAKEQEEKVIIFGDYDVDGVTSTSLLMHLFSTLEMKVSYRLPHRVHDGYGLKQKFVDEAKELGVTLMITVDCGSRDREIVTYGKNIGVDIIVTDHHHIPEDMPDDAIAFVNPSRPDCDYPFTGLAGAGVAFKVVQAFAKEYMGEKDADRYIKQSIDIAAIGTVADCMMLTGENRIIVSEGLKQIKYSRSRGIRTLLEDRMDEDLDGDLFGFFLGPRLNAAGRIDTPYTAVNLLLNNSDGVIETIAKIENLNAERKQMTQDYTDQALQQIDPRDNIIFYSSSDISHGIIGIVAGRITERFFKPAIALKDEGEKLVASCRSPDYFSIVDILEKYKEYFIAFGGHKNAAGFSIEKSKYPEFRNKILEDVNKRDFSLHKKTHTIDKRISLDQIGMKFVQKIQNYKPFGMGNPKPLFLIEDMKNEGIKFVGKTREHIKLENSYGFKIFGFGFGEHYDTIRSQQSFSLVCELSLDNWQGNKSVMIRIVDIIF